jgi:hypothetical protein
MCDLIGVPTVALRQLCKALAEVLISMTRVGATILDIAI